MLGSKKTHLRWSEPWFFLIRIREAWGWRNRILIALAAALLVAVGMMLVGDRGPLEAAGTGLAAGALLFVLMDIKNLQRDVTILEGEVVVSTDVGRYSAETIPFADIRAVQLRRASDWDRWYSAMILVREGDGYLTAVPNKVPLERVAEVFHDAGIAVDLAGWEPTAEGSRVAVGETVPIDEAAVEGGVTLGAVGDDEVTLLPPASIAVQVLIAFGPFLLALAGAIWAGVMLFQSWGDLGWGGRIWPIVAAVLGLGLTFVYAILVGQFAAAAYGVSVARGRLNRRERPGFDGADESLVTVENFPRDRWHNVAMQHADFGFLNVDRTARRLVYEGQKTRWELPFAAVKGCRIERAEVGSGADPSAAEVRSFVVLSADGPEGDWEAPLVYTRTEIGNDTNETRSERARLLFGLLGVALTR